MKKPKLDDPTILNGIAYLTWMIDSEHFRQNPVRIMTNQHADQIRQLATKIWSTLDNKQRSFLCCSPSTSPYLLGEKAL